jgi:hypothetical protein
MNSPPLNHLNSFLSFLNTARQNLQQDTQETNYNLYRCPTCSSLLQISVEVKNLTDLTKCDNPTCSKPNNKLGALLPLNTEDISGDLYA